MLSWLLAVQFSVRCVRSFCADFSLVGGWFNIYSFSKALDKNIGD